MPTRALVAWVVSALVVASACGDDDASDQSEGRAANASAEVSGAATTEGSQAKEPSGTLVMYFVSTNEQARDIADQFEEIYPDVTVEVVRFDSIEMSERFQTEAAADVHTVDILQNVGFVMDEWAANDLLLDYRSPEIGNGYDEKYLHANHYYAMGQTLNGICYNESVIEDPPATWGDLTDPQYKGQIISQTLEKPGGASAAMIEFREYLGDEQWEYFYSSLGNQDVAFAPTYVEAQEKVVSGEYGVMPVCYDSSISPSVERGAPVKWIAPEPTFAIGSTIAIAADAPNPVAAEAFIDFIISEDGQLAVSETLGQVPVREGVPFPEFAKAAEDVEIVFTPTDFYLDEIAKNQAFYDEKVEEWFG